MTTDPLEEYAEWLDDNRGELNHFRQALRYLGEQYSEDETLTLAGAILEKHCQFSETRDSNLLWLTVELKVPEEGKSEFDKEERMCPLAISVDHQELVYQSHKNEGFFSDFLRSTQGWLKPSSLMDAYAHYQPNLLVFTTKDCLEGENSLQYFFNEARKSCDSGLIFVQSLDERGSKIQLNLQPGIDGVEERVERLPGENLRIDRRDRDLEPFLNWLKDLREEGEINCVVYVGYEYHRGGSKNEDARLYAAFEEGVTLNEVNNVYRFIEEIHDDEIWSGIDNSIKTKHALEYFWEDTKDWFNDTIHRPHNWDEDDEAWKQEMMKVFDKYLGDVPKNWLDENGQSVHETFKTICGAHAIVGEGANEVVSIAGAYLVFLMGVRDKLREERKLDEFPKDVKDIRWDKLEASKGLFSTKASEDIQSEGLECIYELGKRLAVLKGTEKCPLSKPICEKNWIKASLEIGSINSGNLIKDTKSEIWERKEKDISMEDEDDINMEEHNTRFWLYKLWSEVDLWRDESGTITIHSDGDDVLNISFNSSSFPVIAIQ